MTKEERKRASIEDIEGQRDRLVSFPEVFSTEEGEKVLAQICEMARLHLPFHDKLEWNEGRRSLALEILTLAGKSPTKIMQDSIERINRLKGHN